MAVRSRMRRARIGAPLRACLRSPGALAVYAGTGQAAFGEGPDLAVMYRVRHQAPALDGCPPDLRPIVERCLAKNPADRPTPAEILGWCRNHTSGRTEQIAQPWLPPPLTRALPGHVPPPPAPVPPPSPAPAPRTRPRGSRAGTAQRRLRRPPVRGLQAGAAILAAITAGTWLLTHPPAVRHEGTSGSPSARPPRSWLSGTWTGAADQPTGTVTHWTAELRFPDSGRTGTFRFPTLGCSGNLVVTGATRSTASVREDVTQPPYGIEP
jgi:hypothetical protein